MDRAGCDYPSKPSWYRDTCKAKHVAQLFGQLEVAVSKVVMYRESTCFVQHAVEQVSACMYREPFAFLRASCILQCLEAQGLGTASQLQVYKSESSSQERPADCCKPGTSYTIWNAFLQTLTYLDNHAGVSMYRESTCFVLSACLYRDSDNLFRATCILQC